MENAKPISQKLKKFVKSLQSRKERQASNLFVVEGEKLCEELLGSDFNVEFVVLRGNANPKARNLAERFIKLNVTLYLSRSKQFEQMCNTKSPQDILAVVRIKQDRNDYNSPFIALDGVNDPGNLGTIIRTADWFGFRHIILGGSSVDKYNAKTVRASMGSLFRVQVSETANLAATLKNRYSDFNIFAATLTAEKDLTQMRPQGKFGIIFGSEAHGISEEVLATVDEEFRIGGKGQAESLNVAVSLGIACWHFSKYI